MSFFSDRDGSGVIMNEQEIRRKELLRQTRKLYDERQEIPAVHPRYSGAYNSLYGRREDEQTTGGSFRLRALIAVLCAACYIYIDENQINIADINSISITEEIERELISPEW